MFLFDRLACLFLFLLLILKVILLSRISKFRHNLFHQLSEDQHHDCDILIKFNHASKTINVLNSIRALAVVLKIEGRIYHLIAKADNIQLLD